MLYVPVLLNYLDVERYGIWVTIVSVTTWIGFFDIGIGMGLKNQLSKALAKGNIELAKEYISTTYIVFSIIFLSVLIIILAINPFLNWADFLNAPFEMEEELTILISIVLSSFCIRFILQTITQVAQSMQKVAISNMFNPISNLICLIIIYSLTKTTNHQSLIVFGSILSITPIFIYVIGSIIFFRQLSLDLSPSLKYLNFKHVKVLLNLGVQFFIVHIAILILTQSSLILISNLYGPQYVTEYNIAFKYFAIIYMIYSIIIKIFWPAFTEAWVKTDVEWIKKSINKLLYLWFFLCALGIFMYFISDLFYSIWIGKEIIISKKLSFFMLLYNLLLSFGGIFSTFLSAINKLRVQLISYIIGGILFYPLVIIFNHYTNIGFIGVLISMIISSIYYLIAPMQYYLVINNKANGIWNK